MNQTLDIASRILASIVLARPAGNHLTQAQEALARTATFLDEAKATGIDITDRTDPGLLNAPVQTGFTPPSAPADPKPLSFGSKRKA